MPDRRFAWFLIVLAVTVRAGAVLALQSHTVPHSTYEHGEIAANLLAGRGFSVHFLGADGPTSQQAPVYPVLVAAAYAIGGVETPRALLILELGQSLLGGLLVVGVLRLAREVAPDHCWVGRAAGLIAALHPTLIYSATHVQIAGLAATLLTFALASAYRTGRTGDLSQAIGTGLWLTLLTLTDPILGLATVGAGWAVVNGQGVRGSFRPIGVMGLTLIIGLLPWTYRNFQVHGEVVAVKCTFGYAFWQGNCALSEGTDKVVRDSVETVLQRPGSTFDPRGLNATLWAARHKAGYLDDIALTRDDYRKLAAVSEPERSRILFRRAIADLKAEPSRYLRLSMRRLRYFVLFDETNPKTRNAVYRASHLGLSMFAMLGLILGGKSTRRMLGPTLITVGLIAGFHALTIVSARFHVPIEPILGLWGACGLSRFDSSTTTPDNIESVGIAHQLPAVHFTLRDRDRSAL